MANPEHVKLVKQGAKAIKAWRKKNPNLQLELSEADLSGANLSGANVGGANLDRATLDRPTHSGADLSGANLRHANLHRAQLRGANLNGANLNGASLIAANLCEASLLRAQLYGANLNRAFLLGAVVTWANLCRANLRGAFLGGANLSNGALTHADLTNATTISTVFGDVDLSDVKGLQHVRHQGPSTIGIDTLLVSKGKIPEVFLRGCGVPDTLIAYLPSLLSQMHPIQFYSCFISYCGEDDDFARRLHARLQAEKLRVWFAPEDMKGGEKSKEQIDQAIRVYDRLLLVLSEESINSDWVRHEIERARAKEKTSGKNVLFPITLIPHDKLTEWEALDSDTGEDLAKKVREYHIPDFSDWKQEDHFEEAFASLMADLKKENNKTAPDGSSEEG